MEQEFTGEIIEWRGPAPYYFVPVPEQESVALRAEASAASYGWGMLPIQVRIGGIEWKTSLWPKDGGYLVPLKDAVRKRQGLDAGDTVDVRVALGPPKPKKQRPAAKRARVPRPAGSREPVTDEQLTIVPANEAAWADLQAIFGPAGDTARCWCQRFRMLPGESWASEGPEELAARLREQTACGDRNAPATSGLVAYLDVGRLSIVDCMQYTNDNRRGEPVGWCAVAPRADHPRLLRDFRIPWLGRDEDRTDPSVWAVTCFVTRVGYRRRGVGAALARASVAFARERGARAVEGYPDLVDGGHVGTPGMFAGAGFAVVSRPGNRRAVMRIDF